MVYSPDPMPSSEEQPVAPLNTNQTTAFRFKSRKHPRSHSTKDDSTPSKRHKHSHRHHHHHHRSRRYTQNNPDVLQSPPIDADTAFRESLFDALADDEGAAYWEGIYGQPIHIYSPYRQTENTSSDCNDLKRMTDEEYTAYVRTKMWEKTHRYVLEERAKREEDRKKAREKQKQEAGRMNERMRERVWGRDSRERDNAGDFKRYVSRDTGHTREKSGDMSWRNVWVCYRHRWEELHQLSLERISSTTTTTSSPNKPKTSQSLSRMIPYPVYSLQRDDVTRDKIELFMRNATKTDIDPGDKERHSLQAILKAERIRWHPDKVQQRYGHMGLDNGTIRAVTAVFQVVDHMWGELKECAT